MTFVRNLTIERLTIVILFILLFTMAVRVPIDTDTWWHVRSGEYIFDEGKIPKTDPFSHTRAGEDWIDHSWGSQIVIYGAYSLFGGDGQAGDSGNIGLALYMALLATLGMAFVYLMCDGTAYVRAFAVVLGGAAAAVFWSPRPQMFSFMLGALVLYLLHLYKRKGVDRLWLIPVVMVVWVNLHGGFAIGFIFLFGSIAGEVIGNVFNPDDERVVKWERLRKMLLITGVAFLVVPLNPNGFQMWAYPFRTVGIGALQDFIQEWRSPDFHQPQTWPFILLLLGVLAAAGLSSRRIDWTDLALVSGTTLMALTAGRNIAVFAIAVTPVLTRHIEVWLADRGWQIRPMRRVQGQMLVLNWVLLVVVIFGSLVKIVSALNEETMREAHELYLPVELAAFLDDETALAEFLGKPPDEAIMFNTYNWGGYLLFAAPDVPVYVDGRTDLYDDEFLRNYLEIVFLREDWEQKLDATGADFVAIEADSVLAQMLRTMPEKWDERLFDGDPGDERSAIFVRREVTNE
ncbi:MAG: hypothetical protein GYB65_00880 [Chloroflexi bacterium]|nr:hypothetical protein [Chloroflexota bacterium]